MNNAAGGRGSPQITPAKREGEPLEVLAAIAAARRGVVGGIDRGARRERRDVGGYLQGNLEGGEAAQRVGAGEEGRIPRICALGRAEEIVAELAAPGRVDGDAVLDGDRDRGPRREREDDLARIRCQPEGGDPASEERRPGEAEPPVRRPAEREMHRVARPERGAAELDAGARIQGG